MCLEGRALALLAAFWPVVVSACTAGYPASSVHLDAEIASARPVQNSPAISERAASVGSGARVRGRLSTDGNRRLANGVLVMSPEENNGSAAAVEATVLPDGSFLFENVQPGSYQIRALARTEGNGGPLFALFRIVVRRADIDGLDLKLLPAATITGTVHADKAQRSKSVFAGARVTAPFTDGSRFGEALPGDVLADGSFTIGGVMAGQHLLIVEALPPPWVLERVTYRGRDVTDVGLQADAADRLQGVEITVTDIASEVSGVVRDAEGHPAVDALVLVVPQDPRLWPVGSRRFGRLRTDARGEYRIRGLPSGDYRIAAFRDVDDRAGYRTDILRSVREVGTPVGVEVPGGRTVDLPVVSGARISPR